jgi:putative DNA primase/helicase
MLARPNPPLPPLTRVVEVPVFARDGTLQTTPGYHPASATFLDLPPGLRIPEVPSEPTSNDVSLAKCIVDEILVDFPFAQGDPCRESTGDDLQAQSNTAHCYALLLLPFARDLIDDPTPLHLIEALSVGSGKGLLANALLRVSLGHHVGTLMEAREDEEWRKRLSTVFKQIRAAVVLDNLRRPLDSGQLAAALTAWTWEDRILGTNEIIRVPVRCVWCATGNNLVLSTEMARRTVRIRLDPNVERPWLRTGFKHPDLLGWVSENRGKFVWAALVLVQHWLAKGRPAPANLRPLGSFEQWSLVMGGILEAAGISGFLSNLEEFYELSDHEGAVLRAFVKAWWDKFDVKEVGVAELLPLALATDGFEINGKDEGGQRRSLGRALGHQRNRVIGTWRICKARVMDGKQQWKLINLGTIG